MKKNIYNKKKLGHKNGVYCYTRFTNCINQFDMDILNGITFNQSVIIDGIVKSAEEKKIYLSVQCSY